MFSLGREGSKSKLMSGPMLSVERPLSLSMELTSLLPAMLCMSSSALLPISTSLADMAWLSAEREAEVLWSLFTFTLWRMEYLILLEFGVLHPLSGVMSSTSKMLISVTPSTLEASLLALEGLSSEWNERVLRLLYSKGSRSASQDLSLGFSISSLGSGAKEERRGERGSVIFWRGRDLWGEEREESGFSLCPCKEREERRESLHIWTLMSRSLERPFISVEERRSEKGRGGERMERAAS